MTDSTAPSRPGEYEQIARRVVAWQEIALNDEGAPLLTMSRAVLNDLVADTELVLRDLERALADLAAERARCDEIAGFVREHRARIHRPTCMDGNGCRCGLIDLPMWGERHERRGVRA